MSDYTPTMADRLLENRLLTISSTILYADLDKTARRELWREYTELHATRSPEMVEHLERKMGLKQ